MSVNCHESFILQSILSLICSSNLIWTCSRCCQFAELIKAAEQNKDHYQLQSNMMDSSHKTYNCLRSNPTLWETLLSGMLAKLAQLTQNQDKRQEAIEKHVSCRHRCSGPSQTGARTGFTKCCCSTETNILISSGPATMFTLACCYVALVQTEKKTEVLHTEIKVQPPSHNADFSFSF